MNNINPSDVLPENLVSSGMSASQFEQNEDLQIGLPVRPVLIPELVWVPVSLTSLTLYGSQIPRTLHCAQGVTILRKLLSLLDGSKTLDELSLLFDNQIEGGAKGFISLLFRYGLLEEGDDQRLAECCEDENITAWYGRFIGNTRKHANRAAVVDAVKRIVPLVVAPAELYDSMLRTIEGIPFADAHVIAIEDLSAFPDNATHAIFIGYTEVHATALEAIMDAWLAMGHPYFCARIGQEEMQQGPYVIPGFSAIHRCAAKQLSVPNDQSDPLIAAWWAVLAVHEFTQVLSGLTRELYINTLRLHDLSGQGRYIQRVRIARLWGTPWENGDIQASTEGGYISWLHHVSTRPPPHEYLAPTLFQTHFSLKNIKLYAESGLALLPATDSTSKLTWSATADVPPLPLIMVSGAQQTITPTILSTLLRYSAGRQTSESGVSRRIAPSAGSLQSVSFYLVVNDVEGIAPGIYYYNGESHQLQHITHTQQSTLMRLLYGPLGVQEPDRPAVTLLLTSYLARLRDKYDDFGLNLAYLDTGVASSYLNVCAAALGCHLSEPYITDYTQLTELLFQSEGGHEHLVTSVFHLFVSEIPTNADAVNPLLVRKVSSSELLLSYQGYCGISQSEAARDTLRGWQEKLLATLHQSDTSIGETLLKRRARYDFAAREVPAPIVERLVALMLIEQTRHAFKEAGQPLWQPWVILPKTDGAGGAGVYACDASERASWTCLGYLTPEQLNACVNQASFARAGLILLVVTRMGALLSSRGKQGYCDAQRQAGAAIALAWMGATDAGLVGAPCGGFLEHGLRHQGIDGFHQSVMFSLVLGQPALLPQTTGSTDAVL